MKYRAVIRMHSTILDNAGVAVKAALKNIGFEGVNDVRIGKILEYDASSMEEALEIANSQTNEVMEYNEVKEI